MLKTFKEIRRFNSFATSIAKSPEQTHTKLGYATRKVAESVVKILQEYQIEYNKIYFEEVESVQIDNALTDPKTGALLVNEKLPEHPYLYTAEGKKKVMLAERNFEDVSGPNLIDFWDKKEFEITPFYISEFPVALNDQQIEIFSGFIIDPENPPIFPKEEIAAVETASEVVA